MTKYQLIVMTGDRLDYYTVFAEKIITTTGNGTSSGYYAFYADHKLVCCYPIERTIISSIEDADGN
ncbi:hypothetical protein UFOVP1247_163 [uncultured Caudovirales phage]|uniref:Uncharacterized protein n=1 Tax=uncultured Caudovirales phage TaxID=2100421 RepID=A0A6J5RD15_9CAUD|nr:hypothetical protein UFOVP970_203 [uncultured Caudovirales phage]CAB4193792.1 hypothetical protein UFOVP1247_163 [uncultured Caudovirales phage]